MGSGILLLGRSGASSRIHAAGLLDLSSADHPGAGGDGMLTRESVEVCKRRCVEGEAGQGRAGALRTGKLTRTAALAVAGCPCLDAQAPPRLEAVVDAEHDQAEREDCDHHTE